MQSLFSKVSVSHFKSHKRLGAAEKNASLKVSHLPYIALHQDGKDAKDNCTLLIDDRQIKPTTKLKILGVNNDWELSFSDHASDICQRASQT